MLALRALTWDGAAAIIGAVTTGAFALAAVVVAAGRAWRDESRRRREDRHLELSVAALGALQRLVRVTIDVAYSDLEPGTPVRVDTAEQAELRSEYHRAITGWNAAMYGVLVGADAEAARSVRQIDVEVDSIIEAALERRWDRPSFRARRARLGELMAVHIDIARSQAHLPLLELGSVWTWTSPDTVTDPVGSTPPSTP